MTMRGPECLAQTSSMRHQGMEQAGADAEIVSMLYSRHWQEGSRIIGGVGAACMNGPNTPGVEP